MLILQGLKRYFTLSGFTRRAHGFYPVIEEIVEGFVEGFWASLELHSAWF